MAKELRKGKLRLLQSPLSCTSMFLTTRSQPGLCWGSGDLLVFTHLGPSWNVFPVPSALIDVVSSLWDVWGKQNGFPNRKFLKFPFWLDTGKKVGAAGWGLGGSSSQHQPPGWRSNLFTIWRVFKPGLTGVFKVKRFGIPSGSPGLTQVPFRSLSRASLGRPWLVMPALGS